MYENTTGYHIQMNRQKAKIIDIKTKIDQLEKELCPECKKKFANIFPK